MPRKILIVDDQPSLRQMLRFALHSSKLEIFEAENGVDALEKLDNEAVDLMIVDWQMPMMDGLELVREVRSRRRYADMPIIFISSLDSVEARSEAGALGVLTWLKKPFRISEIQTLVGVGLGPPVLFGPGR